MGAVGYSGTHRCGGGRSSCGRQGYDQVRVVYYGVLFVGVRIVLKGPRLSNGVLCHLYVVYDHVSFLSVRLGWGPVFRLFCQCLHFRGNL